MNINPTRLFNIYGEDKGTGFAGNVWDINTISPTLTTMGGGNRQPLILTKGGNTEVKVAISKNNADTPSDVSERFFRQAAETFIENQCTPGETIDASRIVHPGGVAPTVKENHGTVTATIDKMPTHLALDEQNKYIRTDGTVGTIMTDGSSPKHNNRVIEPTTGITYVEKLLDPDITMSERASLSREIAQNYRIRKLTPKECWSLMGFDDTDFDKAEKVCSNTQLYKQAGNSIVVNVLERILGALLQKQSRSEWLNELLGDV